MCGRYTLTSPDELLAEFSLTELPFDFGPRFNIAPSQEVPVVVQEHGNKALRLLRWGLIPPWSKRPAAEARMINARSETVDQKPAFRSAFERRRCLVTSDGFFEWKKQGRQRVPYYVRRPGHALMTYAGIWQRHQSDQGDQQTFAILTTQANELLAPLHERMPVIIAPEHYDRWLAPESKNREDFADLFEPPADDMLELFEVSERVNAASFDSPECIRKGPTQQSLF